VTDATGVPQQVDADDGESRSLVLDAALAERAAGRATAADVLDAVASARLLVPVVAVLDEAETDVDGLRHEKQSSMATVLVESPEGKRALLAFTAMDRMQTWQTDARPVPMAAPLAARAALDEQASLYIDAAGPVPFAIDEDELLALAALARPAPADLVADPVLQRALRRHFAARPWITQAWLESTGDGPATLTLLTHGLTDGANENLEAVFNDLSRDRVVGRLLGPIRLGLAPAAIPPGHAGTEVYRRV
jgi:hypothetical protein